MVENETSCKIQTLCTDRGGEYMSGAFKDFLGKKGIKHQCTMPYTPQQNGVAKRKNRSLMEMARCMLKAKSLPHKLWMEAVSYVAHVLNSCPTRALKTITSYEAWYDKKPSNSYLCVFGCLAYAHIPQQLRGKFDDKAVKCIFVGYSNGSKSYRLYNPAINKIFESFDVIFAETTAQPMVAFDVPHMQTHDVFEGRVEEMDSFVSPRPYTLAIVDASYGFCAPNSINDDVKYGVSAYKKVIEAFEKVTTCDSWSLVYFHAHDQITATQKAFTDSNKTCQMLTWVKTNIHGYKLDRLSWACEFATIGFYSSLETGTTTVSALKRCRNVVAVECDSLQVTFIEQRVTALKELLDEFQEVRMKSTASDPRFFDASGEPQPPIGSEKAGEIVDLVDFETDNVEVEEQVGDTPLQITSLGEEIRNEEEEEIPNQE
ncbi:hypothetical protein L7F22_063302 [Adiantum nelumboides]|nr:hypothetical protein [Adiantum nelumboides]